MHSSLSVNDQEGDQYQNNGFSDNGMFESVEYVYDNNGNMTYDLNKKILGIDYNYLNLPVKINLLNKNKFLNVLFQYDATGNKRVKQSRINGRIIKTTNYIGNFVYEDGLFKYLLTSEGRIEPIAGEMVYQYFITDHLGNNRVMFDQDNLIKQQSSYYPFGMLITDKRSPDAIYDYNRYLYNGKELHDEFGLDWYDYGARFYDAQLGRFHTVDPLSDNFPSWTPYHYVHNNPLNMIDPTGMSADWVENKEREVYWDENATSQSTTKEGETYLGKNVIIEEGASADNEGNVTEEINEATFTLYTPENKDGPTATMVGNTVSADGDKYATVAAGTMDGKKTTYHDTPAILINGGDKVPTTKENPNPESNYFGQKYADRIYIHAGNKNYKRLTTSKGKAISKACQTGSNGDRTPYTKFMEKVPENTKINIVLKRNK